MRQGEESGTDGQRKTQAITGRKITQGQTRESDRQLKPKTARQAGRYRDTQYHQFKANFTVGGTTQIF